MSIIKSLIREEERRQARTINLIASENYAPPEVLEPLTSILGSKYAEGYPGKRYYAGCEIIDKIESSGIEQAIKAFIPNEKHREHYHANIQPHSGSQANFALYQALLEPGDTVLSLALPDGGHLTHGSHVNFSGKLYSFTHYHVEPHSHTLHYDHIKKLAKKQRPKLIIAGASAYSHIIDFEAFGEIADSSQALLCADISHIAGLIAAGIHPNPFPHCDFITSTTHKTLRGPRGGFIIGRKTYQKEIDKALMPGTQGGPALNNIAAKALCFEHAQTEDFKNYQLAVVKATQDLARMLYQNGLDIIAGKPQNHLFLVNLKNTAYPDGLKAEKALEKAGIITNRNMIPYDTGSPQHPSGIRIGLSAMVTRGLTAEKDLEQLARLITKVLNSDAEPSQELCKEVAQFAQRFKIPE